MRTIIIIIFLVLCAGTCKAQETVFKYGSVCDDTENLTEEEQAFMDKEGIDPCVGAGTTFTVGVDSLSIYDHWNETTKTRRVVDCGIENGYMVVQSDTAIWRLSKNEGILTEGDFKQFYY